MARKKERIDTSGGGGLSSDNPFAGLSSEGLKELPLQQQVKTGRKPEKRRGVLYLRKLKAGKGGKTVTEISGFDMNPQQIEAHLKRLQARLGTGGTCKGKIIELQGEKRLELKAILEADGFRVKGSVG